MTRGQQKTLAFFLALFAGLYLMFSGWFIIGLILIGLAFIIPSA